MTGIVNSVMFGVQGIMCQVVKRGEQRRTTVADSAKAAVLSGAVISVLVTPMEGIKSRLQVQCNSKTAMYAGPLDCVKKVYRNLGLLRGIYRGWLAVALCRMSNWSYFGSYEFFKQRFGTDANGKLPMGKAVAAGGLTGVCYWLSCYPIDVAKARIMAQADVSPPQYRGIRDAFADIYRTQGLKGFFRGFTPCVLRAFPANASCFVAYECVMSVLPEKLR